jgi:hypothetical protein
MARAGARCAPSVRTLLRGFNDLSDTSESLPETYRPAKNRGGHHPSMDDGPENAFRILIIAHHHPRAISNMAIARPSTRMKDLGE